MKKVSEAREYRLIIAAIRRHVRDLDYWKKFGHTSMAEAKLEQLAVEVREMRAYFKSEAIKRRADVPTGEGKQPIGSDNLHIK